MKIFIEKSHVTAMVKSLMSRWHVTLDYIKDAPLDFVKKNP